MLFNSHVFILAFLPATLIGFFVVAHVMGGRAARIWLLLACMVFYGWWSVFYLALLILWIVINHTVSLQILKTRILARQHANLWLAFGITFQICVLAYFKYAAFLVDNVAALTGMDFAIGAIVLPLAISFYTFQQIAFLVDTWRGYAERKPLLDYMLFISFFPQLIAGPILHHHESMPQFQKPGTYRFNADSFSEGLVLFAFGLLKKLCLADPLSGLATPVFAAAGAGAAISMFEAWTATLAFGLGLYFDFSGYSDMAIGLARMFGIRFPYNFNSPYRSLSIVEFWRRWHMTLSRWLRDYVYIALGGNRKGQVGRYVNLFATMLIGGLWHGAAWTFVVWGGLHGIYLAINHSWHGLVKRAAARGRDLSLGPVLSSMITMFAVYFAWIFFAAPNFSAAWDIIIGLTGANGLFTAPDTPLETLLVQGIGEAREQYRFSEVLQQSYAFLLIGAGLLIVHFVPNSQEIVDGRSGSPDEVPVWRTIRFNRTMATALGTTACLLLSLSIMSDVKEFVYFQF